MPKHVDDPETTRRTQAFADLLCAELGIDRALAEAVTSPVLATVGQVAHGSARPAGALSAFLAGVALGREAGSSGQDAPSGEQVRATLTRVRETVRRFEEQEAGAGDAGAADPNEPGEPRA
ncbi:DUF6457 domain-containing protein [Actinomyces radicidentis]|uniref:DUF6457 domain-containing protein n=1 Tax=Actinomyces radicidentis TaxID=111015 RepID=UPI0028EF1857|nr:DUF6457 domain-containing protein [Actinomyces radicidentis]